MFNGEEPEEPASIMIEAHSGFYDINNMPGYKRKQLIESGAVSIDRFTQADNVPGHKLKKMRDALKKNLGFKVKESSSSIIDITTLEIGGLVSYKNTAVEIKELDIKKGKVYINVKGLHKGWVNIKNLKSVIIPAREEKED